MSDPKNDHYVPKMYLEPLATDKGRSETLVAVELATAKLFKPRLKRIGSETNFTRIDSDGEGSTSVPFV